MEMETLKDNQHYGNCTMLDPHGNIIARCSKSRIDWYLNRNLADVVDENTIKLNFDPKIRKLNESNSYDAFYLSDKENICVCCASIENLTRHHIVPYSFRKEFPEECKLHNYHDIVLLCVECHHKYEIESMRLRKQVMVELKITEKDFRRLDAVKGQCRGLAKSILKNGKNGKIPSEHVDKLLEPIRLYLGKSEITDDDLIELSTIDCTWRSSEYTNCNNYIVKHYGVENLVRLWRNHFIKVMNPQYLPKHWDVNHPVTTHTIWANKPKDVIR